MVPSKDEKGSSVDEDVRETTEMVKSVVSDLKDLSKLIEDHLIILRK